MRQVLVTRPPPGAAATAERLRAQEFVPVLAPLLRIELRGASLPPPRTLQAVLVTSAQALPALSPDYRDVELLAVGDATAAAARRRGHVDVTSADGDATDLARLVAATRAPAAGTLLLISGEGQAVALAETLRQSNFCVAHRAVYAVRAVADLPDAASIALRGKNLFAATFFSADTARCFVTLADKAGLRDTVAPVMALAIGAAAGEALAALPWRCVRIAAKPTQDELLALL